MCGWPNNGLFLKHRLKKASSGILTLKCSLGCHRRSRARMGANRSRSDTRAPAATAEPHSPGYAEPSTVGSQKKRPRSQAAGQKEHDKRQSIYTRLNHPPSHQKKSPARAGPSQGLIKSHLIPTQKWANERRPKKRGPGERLGLARAVAAHNSILFGRRNAGSSSVEI